mmetsp:Transcript_51680/g.137661  ORF Transcript_51680/g.137661 Transcript_51680/m.137661 type:complete len:252 (-) Transcript_51680:299-1054(-)
MHILVDVDAARGAAALAHVDEQADVASCGGLVQIRILAYDHGALTAKLQRHLLQIGLAGRLHDPVAHGRAPRERHLANVRVPCDEVPCGGAMAVDDVDDPWGEASLLDKVAHQQARQRGLLAQLHHHCAAHRQCWAQLPRHHEQWKVPRDDRAHYADWLVERETKLAARARRGGDHLASDLVSPACIVLEALDHESEVDIVSHVCRFSVVHGLHLGQPLLVLLHQVGQPEQQVAALASVGVLPRLECRLRS